MGISITSPSQIPVNVVEVGNEISQNAINAISASATPSTGNPMQTLSAMQNYDALYVFPAINQKPNYPHIGWNHPFPVNGNFVTVFSPNTASWWPWNAANTVFHSVQGGYFQNTFDFSFYDWNNTYYTLTGNPNVGYDVTNYATLGYWDPTNVTTYSSSTSPNYFAANGPSHVGNWDNPVGYSSQFYDGMQWLYRYVYLNGSGGFYTADNQYNPPY